MFSIYSFTLEDPAHPLLGPTLSGLLYLVSCPSSNRKLRIIHNILYLLLILRMISEAIELFCIRSDLTAALRNLSTTILAFTNVTKVGTFFIWQKDWMRIMDYVSTLERCQLNEGDQTTKTIINKYTKYSRRVTYCYLILVMSTVTVYSFAPLLFHFISLKTSNTTNFEENLYPEIGSTWVPFDKTKGYKYWIVTFYNIFMAFYASSTLVMYDSNVVALMSFFFGQLDILKLSCERLFDNEEATISHQEIINKFRKCHRHHILLVRNFKLLNSLLSPVMFVYVIVCSAMLCSSAVQLNIKFYNSAIFFMKEATIMEKAWIAEFLAAQIFQLFLFCWHSQKVLDMSLKVNEGVYSSAWWPQDVRINRLVILLGGQLNKSFVFTAGPFVNLNVATFIALLKGTYSYYALLSKVDE